ncbi:MAG TPA: sugar phosphate isomerase/epimerase [Terriglobales bacterium]|nr:sugar phosphate isomerase/epimerase [Terriglobales bacterium]
MDRRTFLGTVTAATLLARRFSLAADEHKIEKVGVQLYSVRDAMKGDFDGTLAEVANIGYREVEFAGYFGRSPKEVKAALDRVGLAAPSTHIPFDQLSDKWPGVLEAAQVIGHSYVVCPSIDEKIRQQPGAWRQIAETFNRAGEAAHKSGIQFAYHNHTFEFQPVEGKLPYDILLAEVDPNLVKMEMDLYWAVTAGADPLAYFNRYPGRFPLVHVKGKDKAGNMTSVAADNSIDWKAIFAQSDKAGIRHYFVEHDQPKDPFASIQASYTYLSQLRF